MNITLHSTNSDRRKIVKSFVSTYNLAGSLHNESNVLNPTILIEHTNPTGYNYCHIPDFGRYYYITEFKSVRTGIWQLNLSVDVLMSYSTQILNLDVIASDIANGEAPSELYVNGEQWASTVKTKTDVISFPNGLLEQGEYILITSGGIAS